MCRTGENARRCDCDSSEKRRFRLRIADIFKRWLPDPLPTGEPLMYDSETGPKERLSFEELKIESTSIRELVANRVPNGQDSSEFFRDIEKRTTLVGESLGALAEERVKFDLSDEFSAEEIEEISTIQNFESDRSVAIKEMLMLNNALGESASNKELDKIFAKVEGSPINQKANEFYKSKNFQKLLKFEEKYRNELTKNYLEILHELRPFGGKLEVGGDLETAQLVADVAVKYYPSEWVQDAGNASSLSAEFQVGMESGFYGDSNDTREDGFMSFTEDDKEAIALMLETDSTDMEPAGLHLATPGYDGKLETAQLWKVGMREDFEGEPEDLDANGRPKGDDVWKFGHTYYTAKFGKEKTWYRTASKNPEAIAGHITLGDEDPEDRHAIAIHEVGHYFQENAAKGALLQLDYAFLDKRSKEVNGGVSGIAAPIPGFQGILAVKAGFINEYSGRVYNNMNASEVMTTGMENLFGNKAAGMIGGYVKSGYKINGRGDYVRPDFSHRDYILGVLASI